MTRDITYKAAWEQPLAVEVTNVSPCGLWLLCRDRELFLSFDDFPWFKDAPIAKIFDVEEPTPDHFYWPALDVDLGMKSIEDPARYPLQYR